MNSPHPDVTGENVGPLQARCFFVSDLHGRVNRYETLLRAVADERPSAVFMGGDLLPHSWEGDFFHEYLIPKFIELQTALRQSYPRIFVILGNDDPKVFEEQLLEAESQGLWEYVHNRKLSFGEVTVYGYGCVPPTPFRLKDWERYDVSRYCDPGCISPEDGVRTMPVDESDMKWGTIKEDLMRMAATESLHSSVVLFHSPPYDTTLDRTALDGKKFEHAPLDVHVGSIAIRRFIEARQPLLTLHGHVHESARLTGSWKSQIGRTVCLSASHDGPELALVKFSLTSPAEAVRELL